MAMFITPEPPQRPLRATVEAAAECREAALERASLRTLLREEPPCNCIMTGDLFDPRTCEAHNPNSAWNESLRAVTTVERYAQYQPATAEECPF
jgi:hypothetical protein